MIEISEVMAFQISAVLVVDACKTLRLAEEHPQYKSFRNAADRKFKLMNEFREKLGLSTFTVEELREKL